MYFIFFVKPDPNLNHCIKIFAIFFPAFEKFQSYNNIILILRILSDWFGKLLNNNIQSHASFFGLNTKNFSVSRYFYKQQQRHE